jgi:hypothetical protein
MKEAIQAEASMDFSLKRIGSRLHRICIEDVIQSSLSIWMQ